MACIYIVPIRVASHFWHEPLGAAIRRAFGIVTRVTTYHQVDLSKTFNSTRNQYHSSEILLQLIQNPLPDALKILGVVDVDLCIPVLTFVFGEAQLDNIASVVSLHRLDNRFYGLPHDQHLLIGRLIKESVHELGHTFGLLHCNIPGCVLNASTYVEDIDQKSDEFCQQCWKSLHVKVQHFQSVKGIR